MAWCLCCLQGERKRCRFVIVTGSSSMSSDWIVEHKESNAIKGGAPMAWCLCCLQGERKRCRFVIVTGSSSMSSDWIGEHKESNATKGGAPMAWCLCCLQGERKKCRFVIVTQCLQTGLVSTKSQIRPREVRRWRGVCVAFRAKERGVVS